MPSGWLFLFFAMMWLGVHAESIYDHEVKNYELITPLIIALSETSRNLSAELEIQFWAFGKSFRLLLHEDSAFQDLEVESFEKHGQSKSVRVNSTFFEGTTNNTPDSVVDGYLCQEVFCGTFEEDGVIYFMESAEFFFSNSSYSGKAIIYRRKDIEGFVQDQRKHGFEDSQNQNNTLNPNIVRNLLFSSLQNFFGHYYYPKGIDRSSRPDADYACHIEMVADHTLYQHFNKDMDALSAFLYLHGKYADSVFRKTDFDGNGLKDNIRIVVKKLFVYKSANEGNYPMAYAADLLEFLKRFTRRIQNYCLSVCICNRRYSSPAIGRAYKPTRGIRGSPGGICQKVLKLRGTGGSYVPSSLNTAVVTIRNNRGETLPLITTLLAVTHEIGHSFGSDHDPLDNLLCSPGDDLGYYLMHPKTTRELKRYSNAFSPCSRQEIQRTLQDRGGCLKVVEGTCGNGIREGDEECDCGWEGTCKILDPCCTPKDAKTPEKPCTFRRSEGAQCSPKESPCCSKGCSLDANNDTVCYNSDAACLISYCEVNSSSCPVPQNAPDGYPCQSTSKTCLGGSCNSSVCLDNGLEACTCEERHQSCFVCCEKGDQCRPAHTLGLNNQWVHTFVAMAGSRCNGSEDFRCDGGGNCVNVRARRIDDKSGQGVYWWTLGILVVVFLLLLLIFLYLLKSHCGPSSLQVNV